MGFLAFSAYPRNRRGFRGHDRLVFFQIDVIMKLDEPQAEFFSRGQMRSHGVGLQPLPVLGLAQGTGEGVRQGFKQGTVVRLVLLGGIFGVGEGHAMKKDPGGTTPGAMAANNELANTMPPVPPVTESFESYGGKDKNFSPV